MLHFESIEPATLELLIQLQQIPLFKDLRLVGGTGLALLSGHRKSVDIDLFGDLDADDSEILEFIRPLGDVRTLHKTKNINVFLINGIKTDIVRYNYKWLEEVKTYREIRIAGKMDIAAMKLAAVTGRGTKKDFIDIALLLKDFSLQQMMQFYFLKYPEGAEFLVLKSLGYFGDAEKDPMPFMLQNVPWEETKFTIIKALTQYQNY